MRDHGLYLLWSFGYYSEQARSFRNFRAVAIMQACSVLRMPAAFVSESTKASKSLLNTMSLPFSNSIKESNCASKCFAERIANQGQQRLASACYAHRALGSAANDVSPGHPHIGDDKVDLLTLEVLQNRGCGWAFADWYTESGK